MKWVTVLGVVGVLGLLLGTSGWAGEMPPSERYPYGEAVFTGFAEESFRETGLQGDAGTFYKAMDGTFRKAGNATGWDAALDVRKVALAKVRNPKQRAVKEKEIAAWVHRSIKKTVPRFSLDRGFEFANTVRYGERQCFLQATVIAGMLQEMGMDAGVVMIWRNIAGKSSNNGHAATLLKLSDGTDIIVDASEPMPFPRHRGVFAPVGTSGYRFLSPVFVGNTAVIRGYTTAKDEKKVVAARTVRTLDTTFLRSQFYYYRGERAVGGLLSRQRTKAGLETEVKMLGKSVAICPQNPLSVYMLAQTYRKLGDTTAMRKRLAQADGLYEKFGWIPDGVREAVARANR